MEGHVGSLRQRDRLSKLGRQAASEAFNGCLAKIIPKGSGLHVTMLGYLRHCSFKPVGNPSPLNGDHPAHKDYRRGGKETGGSSLNESRYSP